MLVLALDTTTRGGSCAVVRDGEVVHERGGDPERPHDARLPGDLMTLLDEAALRLDDIDVHAVATGPGSFTGLRIGIATMQGLAFAGERPLIGVSAFDALAHHAAAAAGGGRIATWIDAWRGDVYAALYDNGVEVARPIVRAPSAVLDDLLAAAHDPADVPHTLFIGDAAEMYRDLILDALGERATIADPSAPLLAGTLGRLAAARARAGERPPPHAIRPLYVRRPDAELARDARAIS